jgi:hypothetical protein
MSWLQSVSFFNRQLSPSHRNWPKPIMKQLCTILVVQILQFCTRKCRKNTSHDFSNPSEGACSRTRLVFSPPNSKYELTLLLWQFDHVLPVVLALNWNYCTQLGWKLAPQNKNRSAAITRTCSIRTTANLN